MSFAYLNEIQLKLDGQLPRARLQKLPLYLTKAEYQVATLFQLVAISFTNQGRQGHYQGRRVKIREE